MTGTTARGDDCGGKAYVQARAVLDILATALAQVGADLRHFSRTVA